MATYKLFKTPNGKFLKTASGKFLAQSTPFVGSEPTGDYYLAKDKIIGSSSGYYAIHHTYDIWATGDLSWLLCPVGMWQNDSENPAFWSYSGDYAFLANQETQADRASFASTFQELSNGVDIGKGGAVVGVEDGGDGSHVLLKEVSTIMPWAELATLFDNLRQTSTAFATQFSTVDDALAFVIARPHFEAQTTAELEKVKAKEAKYKRKLKSQAVALR